MSDIGALAGIRVLEVGGSVAAAYCSKLLADMGAEVIKIEPVGSGDPIRRQGPFKNDLPDNEAGGLHLFLNRNKRSVTLNLGQAAGRRLLREIAGQAQLLIDASPLSETPAIDHDALMAADPRLVIVSITPFGRNGPFALYAGGTLIGSHGSGIAYMNPAEGVADLAAEPPLQAPGEFADYTVGITAALACLSAILSVENGQGGTLVDVSEQEALASTVRTEMAAFTYEKDQPGRLKMRKRSGGMLYPCADGHVVMSGTGDGFWPALVKMMGEPDWTREEWCKDSVSRHTNIERVNAGIGAWSSRHSTREVDRLATEMRVPCGIVQTVAALDRDEQLAERDFFITVPHPTGGELRLPGPPYKLSSTPWASDRDAPRLGEHNEAIYCGELGYDRATLVRMRQSDVI